MSDYYSIVSSRPGKQVLSQTESAPVELVTISTKPTGINTVVLVPQSEFENGDSPTYLVPPAVLIEELLAGGLVAGMVQIQDTDASNLLKYYMQATVSYTPPGAPGLPLKSYVNVPNSAIASTTAYGAWVENYNDPIKTAYQTLQTLANS